MKNTNKMKSITSALVLGSALLFGNLAYAKESVFVTKEDCDKHYSKLVQDRKKGSFGFEDTSVKGLEIHGYDGESSDIVYNVLKSRRILYACEKVYGNNENKK